jgi:hypothetical protein
MFVWSPYLRACVHQCVCACAVTCSCVCAVGIPRRVDDLHIEHLSRLSGTWHAVLRATMHGACHLPHMVGMPRAECYATCHVAQTRVCPPCVCRSPPLALSPSLPLSVSLSPSRSFSLSLPLPLSPSLFLPLSLRTVRGLTVDLPMRGYDSILIVDSRMALSPLCACALACAHVLCARAGARVCAACGLWVCTGRLGNQRDLLSRSSCPGRTRRPPKVTVCERGCACPCAGVASNGRLPIRTMMFRTSRFDL